jgi:hypothetical protein
MEVKGTAFLARKVMLTEEFGEDRWNGFLRELSARQPIFGEPIHATTLIPMPVFVAFNDAAAITFYGGDPCAFLRFGEKSAEYALVLGPFKRIRETNSVAVFVESARFIYQSYYTAGRAEGSLEGDIADLKLLAVPAEHRHLFLEQASAAYIRRGMELISMHSVAMECLRGFSRGDEEVHYRYTIERTPAPSAFCLRRRPHDEG